MQTFWQFVTSRDVATNLFAEFLGLVAGFFVTLFIIDRVTLWQQLRSQAAATLMSLDPYRLSIYSVAVHSLDTILNAPLGSPSDAQSRLDQRTVPDFETRRYRVLREDISKRISSLSESTLDSDILSGLKTIPYQAVRRHIAAHAKDLSTALQYLAPVAVNFPLLAESRGTAEWLARDRSDELKHLQRHLIAGEPAGNELARLVSIELAGCLSVANDLNDRCEIAARLYISSVFSCLSPRWNPLEHSHVAALILQESRGLLK